MNKKKLISLCLVVITVIGIVSFSLYNKSLHADYTYSEKNTFAMGTVVSQKVYSQTGDILTATVTNLIVELENEISRKKENSDVSVLNEKGEIKNSDIYTILLSCQKLKEKSGGAFNVGLGNLVDLWGIDEGNKTVPDEKEIAALLKKLENGKLTFDSDGQTVTLDGDFQLDLGAVGKGLACDRAIAYYKADKYCEGAIISVGGSIGCFGSRNKAGDKWKIAIRHPRNENEYLGVISLDEGFISTSGDYEKYFTVGDTRYHHILNGNTGYPSSSGIISVTVVCDNGFLSDALSTVCLILGIEKSEPILKEYNASAVFVNENMEITTVGDVEFEKQN